MALIWYLPCLDLHLHCVCMWLSVILQCGTHTCPCVAVVQELWLLVLFHGACTEHMHCGAAGKQSFCVVLSRHASCIACENESQWFSALANFGQFSHFASLDDVHQYAALVFWHATGTTGDRLSTTQPVFLSICPHMILQNIHHTGLLVTFTV